MTEPREACHCAGGQDMGEARHPDLDGENRRGDPEGDAEAAPDEQMAARAFDLFRKGGIRPAGAGGGRTGEPGGGHGLQDQDPQQDGAGIDQAPEDGEIREDDAEEPGDDRGEDESQGEGMPDLLQECRRHRHPRRIPVASGATTGARRPVAPRARHAGDG